MFLNNVFHVLYLSSLVLFLCFKHLLHNFSFVIQGLCSVRFFKFWCLLRKCYIKGSKIYFQEPAALPFCGLVTESWRRSMRLTMLECTGIETALSCDYATAWKTSVFEVILVHIFPHSDWIRREREREIRISPYSVQMRENTDLQIPTLFTQSAMSSFFSVFNPYMKRSYNNAIRYWILYLHYLNSI